MQFAMRMERFGEGVFTRLADIQRQKLSSGEAVIDLSIGAPDIPPAQHLLDAMAEAVRDKANYVYALSDHKELKEAAARWYERRYGVILDPDTEITSLMGSQEGLFHLALAIVNEGDVVLVPDPCYPAFADGPLLAGARLYYMPQKKENGYVIRLSDIPADVLRQAKLMIVSYPNNPTTAVAPDSFYEELVYFAAKYDIIVLHDNAYSELVFDGHTGGSFLRFPGAREVGVEFNSLSKTYGLAGARVGFCVGNKEVVSQLKLLKSNMDYGMFLPVQKTAVTAITGSQSCAAKNCKAYERRRDVLCDGLNRIGWQVKKPAATMFVWARIPDHYQSAEAFAMDMVSQSGVLVTPGSAFGPSGEGYVRMALVQDEEILEEAVAALDRCGILKGKDKR